VGLLSFRRDIEGLKSKVTARREEVEDLLQEKKQVAERIRKARALLEVDARLEELERSLAITENGHAAEEDENISISESEESDEDEVGGTFSIAKLRQRVQQFVGVKRLIVKLHSDHPFLADQNDRIQKIRDTLLLDLKGALKESMRVGDSEVGQLKILALYRTLEEPLEAVKALKDT
jgi:conserved oligomeric Golgi complex subunit 2